MVEALTGAGTEEARREITRQIDFLVRAAPGDPDVVRLQMTQLDPARDAERLKAMYDKLPEQTPAQWRSKGFTALTALHDTDESIRLLRKAADAEPGDVTTAVRLAEIYTAAGRKPDAVAVVTRSLAAKPSDPTLQVVLKELQGVPRPELQKFVDRLNEQNPDVLARETALADSARQNNDLPGAEKHLKAAEAAAPDNNQVLDRLFLLYSQTGQFDKAGPYLAKLAAANADQAHGLLYEFHLAQARRDVDRQIEIGRQLTTELPEFAASYFSLGQAWQAKGDFRQAIDNYDVALQKKADLIDALKAKIECYYAMNRVDAARVAIDEGRRRFPNDPDVRALQIRHQLSFGDPAAAVQTLEEQLKRSPDAPGNWLDLASAHMRVAEARRRVPDVDGANAEASAAHDVLTGGLQRFPDDPRFYAAQADLLRSAGDPGGAEGVLQSLDARPGWGGRPEPQLMLARFYTQADQAAKAEQAYAAALSRSNQDPSVQTQFASLLGRERKFDQALALLDSANADNPLVRRQKVSTLLAAGRPADAEAAIKSALEKNPPDAADLQASWADIELAAGRRDAAADHVAKALAINPRHAPRCCAGPAADAAGAAGLRRGDRRPAVGPRLRPGQRRDPRGACRRLHAPVRRPPRRRRPRSRRPRRPGESARSASASSAFIPPSPRSASSRRCGCSRTAKPSRAAPRAPNWSTPNPSSTRRWATSTRPSRRTSWPCSAPGNPALIQTFLNLLVASRQFDSVLKESESLVDKGKDVWWLWNARGQARAGLGDKAGALADLNHALAAADAQKDVGGAFAVIQNMAPRGGV